MKQLYIIGIVVAVLMMALLGLNKLEQTSGKQDIDLDIEPPVTTEEEQVDKTEISNVTEETMNEEAATAPAGNTIVVMKTTKGDITVELFTSDMPVTAGNFLKLATSDYYDGIKFHRIIPNFMIQGGDPLTKDDGQSARWGTGGPGYSIADEFGPRYGNNRGTLAMANSGPNTGGSQFFINTVNNNFLDGKHPVFGKVIAGMEVVDAISATETNPRDVPVSPIIIESISVQ